LFNIIHTLTPNNNNTKGNNMKKVNFNVTEDSSASSSGRLSRSASDLAPTMSALDISRKLHRMKRKIFLEYVQDNQPSDGSFMPSSSSALEEEERV
jgi:hypothetical protein